MTTDDFTTASRAEAERRYMPYREYPATVMEDREIKAHIGGWEAARTYLAEQEPTDAEVEAAARALFNRSRPGNEYAELTWIEIRGEYLSEARDALSAARAVGRDAR